MGAGVWVGRLAIAIALIGGACAQNAPTDPFASYDPRDPFSDPFFDDGFQSDSLDEITRGPSAGDDWFSSSGDSNADDELLADHADPFWGEGDPGGDADEDGAFGPQPDKSFSEKAQEATLATMSVLVGAGMAALPYLIGAL